MDSINVPSTNAKQIQPELGCVSASEAMIRLSIGRRKFYQEVKAGRITVRKCGRRSLVTLSDLQAWIDALPLREPSKAA